MTPPPPSPSQGTVPRTAPISREQKAELLRENRARLDGDLWNQKLVFESMPRSVDLQLSNFCNMSCTMCYDGVNPPLEKLDEEMVEALAAEILPTAAIVTPFAGSEPLILTWDLTLSLAQRYGVELELITNAQFLDEPKFHQLEPHVSKLVFSIDSHMRDVYERIRLRSKPNKVFENLPRAAQLCRDHGIEPEANVVFMVENAPFMDETVAYLADQGCATVRLLAFHMAPNLTTDRIYSDPAVHMSEEWFDWMMGKIRRVAEEKKIRLLYEGPKREELDFRPSDRTERIPQGHSVWDELRLFYPGYCVQSVDRIKVETDGNVYPCCVASSGNLRLGNVNEQSFQEIWNGPEAQDLRRGMLTLDLPKLCKTCEFHTAWIRDELEHLPMVDWFYDIHCGGAVPRVDDARRTLEITGPEHMTRSQESPLFSWNAPAETPDKYLLVLGVGGTWHEGNRVFEIDGVATEYRVPQEAWAELKPNLGHWWTIWGLYDGALDRSVRGAKLRCVVRHQPIPRVAGSTLYGK